ncbi:hypothetical protein, partial [Staphylococcus aureus]|uniref:hypothetical protein n=1 Tax=Staphylococcus aureus TaxID=1280 RepID=UPI00065B670E
MTERKSACKKLFLILVRGPHKKKMGFPFFQTKQGGGGGPTKRKWVPKFFRQSKVGGGAPPKENWFPISTDKAKWGVGP